MLASRPGFYFSTLESRSGLPSASLVVHLAWAEASARLPTSEEVLSNQGFRQQNWLHELGSGVDGVMHFENVGGDSLELLIRNVGERRELPPSSGPRKIVR